jgi:hypothetical protein
MPALVIDGTPYEVLTGVAKRRPMRRVGRTTAAFSGKLRRTTRAEFGEWEFPLAPLTTAELATLTAVAASGFKDVYGDLVNRLVGNPLEAEIEVGEAVADEDEATGAAYWLTTVIIRQAS